MNEEKPIKSKAHAPTTVSTTKAHSESEPGSRVFVWGVWLSMSLMAIWLVARYGTDIPIWDDYGFVPAMTGDQSITPGWLWEQCNEHRIPLPKLYLVGVGRLAGNDVRVGMFGSVICLSALAAGLIRLVGRSRGELQPVDALFPILLLHPGHAANLLWSIQFIHILATAIGGLVLILIASNASWPDCRRAYWIGGLLALLPLCGGTGLLYVPPLAAWLLLAGWSRLRVGTPDAKRQGVSIALAAVPSLVLTALYFRGFQRGSHPPAPGGVFDNARAGLQFLTGGLGIPASWGWPTSGWLTLGAIGMGTGILVQAWFTSRRGSGSDRPRILGLLAFLAALLAISAGVGWGRGWAGPLAGFQDRYVAMAAPLWCWLAIVVQRYAPVKLGTVTLNGLFVVACVLLWPNSEVGFSAGRELARNSSNLTRDLQLGSLPYQLIRRYTPFLHPSQDEMIRLLPLLKRGKVGPFGNLRENPPFHEVPISVEPTSLVLARWDKATATAHVTGVDPQMIYRLQAPRRVIGVQIRYSHSNPEQTPARFQFSWLRPDQSSYDASQRYSYWTLPTGPDKETTVWIDDMISEFRIQPDNQPCDFKIQGLSLLETDVNQSTQQPFSKP